MKILRLAIVSTHPVQYYAPIFQTLARSQIMVSKVFYTWSQTRDAAVADPGFGRVVTWDVPLLEGYDFEFVPNVSPRPGNGHFRGLQNPTLIPAIEQWSADAVLVFGWNSLSHLAVLRHFKGTVPVFFRGDSTLLDRAGGWRNAARRAFLWWVYRHVDLAVAVGSNNRDYFRWCGLTEERVAFAPHAIDTQRFSEPQASHEMRAAQWRAQLGIPCGARVVLFAGKLLPKKDPLLLLDAFLKCTAPGHLVFVGNGLLESQLRERAKGHPEVHFLPFQNQQAMPSVYRLGDVFVLPSCGPGETWGLALNEAMAAGRPVIASSRAGGARDLVTENQNGWIFEAGDCNRLQELIQQVLTCDGSILGAMGAAAREHSAGWSIAAAAEGLERAVSGFMQGAATKKRHTARP